MRREEDIPGYPNPSAPKSVSPLLAGAMLIVSVLLLATLAWENLHGHPIDGLSSSGDHTLLLTSIPPGLAVYDRDQLIGTTPIELNQRVCDGQRLLVMQRLDSEGTQFTCNAAKSELVFRFADNP